MADNLTLISPLPDSIVRWGKCLLLHERTPIMTEKGIKYICKECQNDNDTTKNQEASQSS